MPELRTDSLTGNVVIVAAERATRPDTFRQSAAPAPATVESCPFCEGHESMTPPEVARTGSGEPDHPGWGVRVVPNLYPLAGEQVRGAHEVVIFSPAHDRTFAQLEPDRAIEALLVMQARVAFHLDAGSTFAQAFVNHGKAAGASIEHPHGQVVAIDFVPPAVDAALTRFANSDHDPVAEQHRTTRGTDYGVVDGDVAIWCPPAASAPFEFVCAALASGPRFDSAPRDEVAAVALALQDGLQRLERVVGAVAYNVIVHTAPRADDRPFHWYVRVLPRITVTAGFEFGTGVLVNVVPPEQVAPALRDAGHTAPA
jgi:UDPglucose--hexose-1-phosphate uridylyltransferase